MILVDYPLLGTMKWKLKWVLPPLESLISSFGAQHCLPNQFYTIYAAAQSPTQTSFLNYGKHPPILRECILANPFFVTPSEYLTLFQYLTLFPRFQALDISRSTLYGDHHQAVQSTSNLGNLHAGFPIFDVGTPSRQTNLIRRPLQDRLT